MPRDNRESARRRINAPLREQETICHIYGNKNPASIHAPLSHFFISCSLVPLKVWEQEPRIHKPVDARTDVRPIVLGWRIMSRRFERTERRKRHAPRTKVGRFSLTTISDHHLPRARETKRDRTHIRASIYAPLARIISFRILPCNLLILCETPTLNQ